jgi:hypothetical protein
VLEEWAESGPSDQPMSKTGCWLVFAGLGLLGIGALVAVLYLFY